MFFHIHVCLPKGIFPTLSFQGTEVVNVSIANHGRSPLSIHQNHPWKRLQRLSLVALLVMLLQAIDDLEALLHFLRELVPKSAKKNAISGFLFFSAPELLLRAFVFKRFRTQTSEMVCSWCLLWQHPSHENQHLWHRFTCTKRPSEETKWVKPNYGSW